MKYVLVLQSPLQQNTKNPVFMPDGNLVSAWPKGNSSGCFSVFCSNIGAAGKTSPLISATMMAHERYSFKPERPKESQLQS